MSSTSSIGLSRLPLSAGAGDRAHAQPKPYHGMSMGRGKDMVTVDGFEFRNVYSGHRFGVRLFCEDERMSSLHQMSFTFQ